MGTLLETRYRRLLRFYPLSYREARGDEILDTLLEVAPAGQTRPGWRETSALMVGGLRVRAGQNRRLSTLTSVRLAAVLGFAMVVSPLKVLSVEDAFIPFWPGPAGTVWGPAGIVFSVVVSVVLLAAVATIWFAPRWVTVIALAVVGLAIVVPGIEQRQGLWLLVDVGGVVTLALLALGRERPPRSWLWLLVAMTISGALDLNLFPLLQGPGDSTVAAWFVNEGIPVAIVIWAVLWTLIDARPLVAIAILAVAQQGPLTVATLASGGSHITDYTWIAIGVLPAIPAYFRLRRQPLP